jgi:hypothetical protein
MYTMTDRAPKVYFKYSKEAQRAFRGETSFLHALFHLYAKNQSISEAKPYSAKILAHASDFIYVDGVLSYMTNNEIRTLDVHGAGRQEQVVNLTNLLPRLDLEAPVDIALLYYSSGIIAFLIGPQLVLLDITPNQPRRLRFRTNLTSTSNLFVRHNTKNLYYGTRSRGIWLIQWVNLTEEKPQITAQSTELVGSELGHTVCFEIFDNHLYAVSNINDKDEEIYKWRSFYSWICIPPNPGIAPVREIWRRDHSESVIANDQTKISLCIDESTGGPVILECRTEWQGSTKVRTCYTEPLPHVSQLSTIKGIDTELPLPLHGPTKEDLERQQRKGKYKHSTIVAEEIEHLAYNLSTENRSKIIYVCGPSLAKHLTPLTSGPENSHARNREYFTQ